MSTTIRVSRDTRARLAKLAEQAGTPMTAIVDQAVDRLERHRFFEELNRQVAALRADPVAWAEYEAERAEWDGTLMDGLRDDPYYTQDDPEPV